MDLNDVWQENKRWILGVLAGVLLFWTGHTVITGIYSTAVLDRQIVGKQREVRAEPLYSSEAFAAAQQEREQLAARRAQLQEALEFRPSDEFVLEGKGDPHLHFDVVSRRVRQQLVSEADRLGVEHAEERNVSWKAPVGESIPPTLLGVAIVEQAGKRLLEAHARVREADPDALGLVSVDTFEVVLPPGLGTTARRRGIASESGPIGEQKVRFKFHADEATTLLFLEACRDQRPPLALDTGFSMTPGSVPGEPLTVSGTLVALRVEEATQP